MRDSCAEDQTGPSLSLARSHMSSFLPSFLPSPPSQVWAIAASDCVGTFDEHEDKVWALAATDDGARLLTGGGDAALTVWSDVTAEEEAAEAEEADRKACFASAPNFIQASAAHPLHSALGPAELPLLAFLMQKHILWCIFSGARGARALQRPRR